MRRRVVYPPSKKDNTFCKRIIENEDNSLDTEGEDFRLNVHLVRSSSNFYPFVFLEMHEHREIVY